MDFSLLNLLPGLFEFNLNVFNEFSEFSDEDIYSQKDYCNRTYILCVRDRETEM